MIFILTLTTLTSLFMTGYSIFKKDSPESIERALSFFLLAILAGALLYLEIIY